MLTYSIRSWRTSRTFRVTNEVRLLLNPPIPCQCNMASVCHTYPMFFITWHWSELIFIKNFFWFFKFIYYLWFWFDDLHACCHGHKINKLHTYIWCHECEVSLLATSVASTVIDPRLAGLSSNGVEGQSDDVLWIRDSPKQFIVFPQNDLM